MQIKVKNRECKKCGVTDIPFYAKKRTDRNNKIYIGYTCILCWREDEGIRNRRSYKLDPDSHIARVMKSRIKPKNYRNYMKKKLEWSRKKHLKVGMETYREVL